MQMGWFIRWLIGYNNLTKDVTTHTFNPPAKQKDGVLTTHILNEITDFWDICMLSAHGFQIRNNIYNILKDVNAFGIVVTLQ